MPTLQTAFTALTLLAAPPADPLLSELNAARQRYGKPALTADPLLTRAAKEHAAWMARTRTLSHKGDKGTWPWDRATAAGYRWATVSEVAAHGQTTAREAVLDWLASRVGHRDEVLGTHRHAGTGSARARDGSTYWCVVFATPATPSAPKPPPCSPRCTCGCRVGRECRCKRLAPEEVVPDPWPAEPRRLKGAVPAIIWRPTGRGC